MSGPVTATWNLDRTVDGAVTVGIGALIAATTDNVQALAVYACEKFGSTLAICDSTIKTIQTKVVPTPEPPYLSFLKSYLGFPKNDCASDLGRSVAGLRFLGLAAALISSMEVSDAAESLGVMLRRTKPEGFDKLPSPRHLRDLLRVLKQRCASSGFTDLTLHWHFKLYTPVAMIPVTPAGDPRSAIAFPNANGLDELVDAFRQLHRIGEATVTRVIIKTWGSSFTEWCLGTPPAVFTHDGRKICGQVEQDVCIIHLPTTDLRNTSAGIKIKVDHTIRTFEDLVGDGDVNLKHPINTRWSGMPSIDQYGMWLLSSNGLDTGDNKRAFQHLIPYALYHVMTCLRFSCYPAFDHERGLEGWLHAGEFLNTMSPRSSLAEDISDLRLCPFPAPPVIVAMLCRLTGLSNVQLQPLGDGVRIEDLPFVKVHLQALKASCRCCKCLNLLLSENAVYKYCECDAFLDKVSIVIADILALSLFVFPDNLRIRIPVRHHQNRSHDFTTSILRIISTGTPTVTNSHLLLDWALTLAGHDVNTELRAHNWAASSSMGQAIWPAIFDTNGPTKYGFLSLKFDRGVFQYEEESYTLVKAVEAFGNDDEVELAADQHTSSTPVAESQNHYPGLRANWRVQVSDDNLKVGLGLVGADGLLAYATVSPCRALANLSSALLVERCPHAADETLEPPDQFAAYAYPIDPTRLIRSENKVAVVAVSGMNDLRLLSLACGDWYAPVVLRGNACLSCCLLVCRRSTHPILIL
ncbi:uncharacterized protein PAC_07721 [Phialocephala subalpina]|uniref:Uncharacterized protein n=1 Tax=Phialocephala subalpina TaxID=576137 RepID=A0A1L7WYJ0_9HELO|nr:uncharacterized protein PAC_07721 [Phialocephala subalpina]